MESAVQKENIQNQLSSVEMMLLPIGENGVGEDPRYGEDFTAVKLEIDRLSDTDYPEVAMLCERILQEKAKDLRVAGYYIMAQVYNEGIFGLIKGVELYLELLKRYGVSCHPQRENAKAQTIAWLNNEKILSFVKNIDISDTKAQESVARLKLLITALNEELLELYDDDTVSWTSLGSWIERNLASVSEKLEDEQSTNNTISQESPGESVEITSELLYIRSVERLLSYLSDQDDLMKVIAVSRAVKWVGIDIPNSEAAITRIPPPREAVIAAVESKDQSKVKESSLFELESYFMESSCQFYLDLQMREMEIAKSIGRGDVAALIESFVRQLTQCQPDVIYLSYCNGMPFANEMTRRLINSLETRKQPQAAVDVVASERRDFESQLSQMIDNVAVIGLTSSVDQASKLEVVDMSQAFRLDLSKIDMCITAGRADLALPLARKLESQVEKYRLAEWDKELALALWDKLLIILQTLDDCTQQSLEAIDELKGKICAMDLGFALRLF